MAEIQRREEEKRDEKRRKEIAKQVSAPFPPISSEKQLNTTLYSMQKNHMDKRSIFTGTT